MTGSLAAESFRAALRNLLDGRGRGSQAELAETLGLARCQQLQRIAELTNDQVGHSQDNLAFFKYACDFLDGELTPAEFYQAYLKLIRSRDR